MSLTLIWPLNDIQGQILSGKLKGHIYMIYYMYFIQTFIIRCTISEILAKIDHKGPNWTFLTLKMTLRVIPYLSYFRAGLVSQQRSYIMQSIWAALRYYWIILIIMGKWAKSVLDLENDLLNNSMKSISWQLINIIPKKLYARNKEKLSECFWENWQNVSKQPNLTLFGRFGPFKMTFRVIQSNPSFGSSLVPSLWSFLHK